MTRCRSAKEGLEISAPSLFKPDDLIISMQAEYGYFDNVSYLRISTMHTDRSATEIIERILPFSRYACRLLESEPRLLAELKQDLQSPFLREDMQVFLNAKAVNGETCLNRVLRSLRKRVMLRLAVRDL